MDDLQSSRCCAPERGDLLWRMSLRYFGFGRQRDLGLSARPVNVARIAPEAFLAYLPAVIEVVEVPAWLLSRRRTVLEPHPWVVFPDKPRVSESQPQLSGQSSGALSSELIRWPALEGRSGPRAVSLRQTAHAHVTSR
jgi:hypothetical protein